jgi:hypothetical protein
MSAFQSRALDSIAFQLAAALDEYDVKFDALMKAWPDMDLYHEASGGIDALRMYSAALPQLSVQYVSLLIAHAELVHCLWQQSEGRGTGDALLQAKEDHRLAITVLRRRCLRLLAGSSPPPPAHVARSA